MRGEQAQEPEMIHTYSRRKERRSDKKFDSTKSNIFPLIQLETADDRGAPGEYATSGSATAGDEGEYTLGLVDGGG